MGWNANSVSDETLHRRRIVVAALGILGALTVIVSTLIDANQGISFGPIQVKSGPLPAAHRYQILLDQSQH